MKKINKTVLLASTLFLSSAVNLTNAHASEDKNLLLNESMDSISENNENDLDNQSQDLSRQYTSEAFGEEGLEANPSAQNLDLSSEETSAEANSSDFTSELNNEFANEEQSQTGQNLEEINLEEINSDEINSEEQTNSEEKVEVDGKVDEERLPGLIYYDDKNLDEALNTTYESSEVTSIHNEQTQIEEENYYTSTAGGYFVKKNNKIRYYKDNKVVKNTNIKVNDKIYRANNVGDISNPKDKWLNIGKDIYYNKADGNFSRGINQIGKNKFYFSQDGILERNKKILTDSTYYELDRLGRMNAVSNKWVNVNNNIYRTRDGGKIAKGVTKVGDKDYMFDKDGKLQTNKKMIVSDKYYEVNAMGIVTNPKNKWFALDGISYRTTNDGTLAKGPVDINGNTYVFSYQTGAMITGRPSITNGLYFDINEKGIATLKKDAWVTYKGKTFHTNNAGYIKKGVWEINGNLYCFDDNGLVLNSTYMQNGIEYKTNEKGIARVDGYKQAGEKNLDYVMDWMFDAKNKGMTYNMGPSRTSEKEADCSSAVYRALIYGGFLKSDAFIGNTETLFAMGAKGTIMREISESDIDYGDIFVSGIPGKSLGEGGHTGFILNKKEDTIIHMNYSGNGVTVTPRKGYMGDRSGRPVKYYRLVGAKSDRMFVDKK